MPAIRYEISKQLDYVPAVMRVIVHKRAVYACPEKHDEAKLITAPKPPQPIDKGLASAGLLAQVVVSKFGDHLPGYRLEDIFFRHGVPIRRSTIYDGIYLQSQGKILEVSCWAHARRYWHKAREQDPARSHHVLGVITRLYEVERAARDTDASELQSLREKHSAPLLKDLKTWLDGEEFLPKSLIGQAATYTRNQWPGLNRYIEDGELTIDNNRAERAMKNVAIGRKNWLFVGSVEAGRRAAW